MMFFLVNTSIAMVTNKGSIINTKIGNPIFTFKSVCLCNLFNVFMIFAFKEEFPP